MPKIDCSGFYIKGKAKKFYNRKDQIPSIRFSDKIISM